MKEGILNAEIKITMGLLDSYLFQNLKINLDFFNERGEIPRSDGVRESGLKLVNVTYRIEHHRFLYLFLMRHATENQCHKL